MGLKADWEQKINEYKYTIELVTSFGSVLLGPASGFAIGVEVGCLVSMDCLLSRNFRMVVLTAR